jgi:hypothetical protein
MKSPAPLPPSRTRYTRCSGVCPGVCDARNSMLPTVKVSPSASRRWSYDEPISHSYCQSGPPSVDAYTRTPRSAISRSPDT